MLFERISSRPRPSCDLDERPPVHTNPHDYRYLTEFQSHHPEFDYLKSLEIEEKINRIRWVKRWPGANSHTLLSTNDKTIKLWKVFERQVISLADFNLQNGSNTLNVGASDAIVRQTQPIHHSGLSPDKEHAAVEKARRLNGNSMLRLPRVVGTETVMATKCRRSYANAHTYHINAIALSSDQETFISADDLRVNMWHLDRNDVAFNIVDIKPASMEDLTEVITAADFHPSNCSLFAYATSKGCIRLADLRDSALCDQHAKCFEDADTTVSKSFFAEIISSINDAKFSPDGNFILARDYMNLKLWDVRKENAPLAVYPVHESLRKKLCDLYENDCIFDKFDCCMSSDGKQFATGTYSNFFKVIGRSGGNNALLEASRDPQRRRVATAGHRGGFNALGRGRKNGIAPSPAAEDILTSDFNNKLLHLSWHPKANVLATAASNSLYFFYGR